VENEAEECKMGSAVKVLVEIHYSCQKWVHKKCSGSMLKVTKSFVKTN